MLLNTISKPARPFSVRLLLLWLLLLTVVAHGAHVCGSVPNFSHGTLPRSPEASGPCLLCLTLQAVILVCLVVLGDPLLRSERVALPRVLSWCFSPYFPRRFVRPPPAH